METEHGVEVWLSTYGRITDGGFSGSIYGCNIATSFVPWPESINVRVEMPDVAGQERFSFPGI